MTDVKPELENAFCPILVTVSGMLIDVKTEQFSNILKLIAVIPLPILTDMRPELENA